MAKYLTVSIFFCCLVLGCNKSSVDPLFDQNANTRAKNVVSDYTKTLTNATSGWKGAYYPNGGNDGGYSFYLKFTPDGKLTMYSDISQAATDQAFETSFQVKIFQKPTLVFDTYSYLHELVNPDYNGGDGAKADQELTFDVVSPDKVILKGRRNNSYLELNKLTAAEYDNLAKGGLANIVKNTIEYVRGDKFIYFNSPSGEKADIFIDYNSKKFLLYFIKNGQVESQEMAFVTTLTGLQFKKPINIFGSTVSELIWDNTSKTYYYLNNGQRSNLSEGKTPALPFYDGLGVLFSEVFLDPSIATQSAFYKTTYDNIKARTIALSTAAPVRVIGDVYFYYFAQDGLFALINDYTRTYPDRVDRFGATILYVPSLDAKGNIRFARQQDTYTLVDGQFSRGASAIVLQGVKELTDALESQSFTWDYDSVESKTALLKSTTNPNIFIKGKLQ
jgi:hypothetical protein